MGASHIKAESTVPSEPQVRTSTLYLSVSGVSRWWGGGGGEGGGEGGGAGATTRPNPDKLDKNK